MSLRRALTLARRVMRQVARDRRTVGLLVVGPMIILTLGAVLFRSEPAAIPIGVVNEDQGQSFPGGGAVELGQSISDELAADDAFAPIGMGRAEVEDALRDGTVLAVVVLPEDFTLDFLQDGQVVLDLRLEGSNPTRSQAITGHATQDAVRALASLAGAGLARPGALPTGGASAMPVTVRTTFLFGGEEFDTMDYIAPVYIALLAMFFVFLLACVSFLRERSQGTMERLLATPATRGEIALGYMLGLGIFGLIQVAIILFFTVGVLKIHYRGSLALLFLVIGLLAIVGVNLGILASAYARNEFQVVQFVPLVLFPQVLLGGTFWSVADLPEYLRPLAYLMPLTYANRALRDVMLKGWGLAEIWPNVAVLVGLAAGLIVLSALTMRREVA